MSLLCPNCAAENPTSMRFCGMCGTPLVTLSARRERRRVTTVFFDLVGFSMLTRDFDPEKLRDLADDILTVVAGIVEAHDGYVDAFQGDGLIALFGAPHSHPDDPERAVLAAAEGLRAVETIGRSKGYPLKGRAGVNTGLVIAGDLGAGKIKGYTVMGSAVNLAARLEAAATPGEVWVGPETYRATRHALRFVPSPVLTLAGFPDVTQAHRFVQEARQRDPYAHLTFVGREPERARLWHALERAGKTTSFQELWLTGEAGSGKTRLAREFGSEVERAGRARVLWLEADPETDTEAGRSRLRLFSEAAAHPVSTRLGSSAEFTPEPQTLLEQLTRSLEGAGATAPDTYPPEDALPLLIITETSPQSAALEPLLSALRNAPTKLLLLRLSRKPPSGEEVDRGPGESLKGAREVLLLPPLGTEECLRILAELVDPSLQLVTESLVHETGGNPAYTIELARTLNNARTGAFSGSLSSLLQARLDMLAPAQRHLLAQLALVGERSWVGLANLLAENSHADLGALLDDDLLTREPDSSLPGEVELRFRSELLRRAALLMVPFSERPALHLRVARWLEAHAPGLQPLVDYHRSGAKLQTETSSREV